MDTPDHVHLPQLHRPPPAPNAGSPTDANVACAARAARAAPAPDAPTTDPAADRRPPGRGDAGSCAAPNPDWLGAAVRTPRAASRSPADRARPRPGGLCAGRAVMELLGLAQGIQRFVDGQKDGRFERAERTAATNRQRHRGHGHVVGGLPQVVAVVFAEGVPEPVEFSADRLDVRLSGLSAVLWVADQPGPSLRRVTEPR